MLILHPIKGKQRLSSANNTENDMSFIKATQTEVNLCQKKHSFTAESISVKRELDDFDNRKAANDVDQNLDQESTIKCEQEDSEIPTELNFSLKGHPFTDASISVKREPDDFDNRKTENEVEQDLDQKSPGQVHNHIKSEEENQNLIRHEEVDIKSEDDGEQSDIDLKTTVRQKPKDEIKIYQCSDCPYQSKYKCSIKQHSVRHKKPDEIVWHRCTECPYKSPWKANLKQHAAGHNETRQVKHESTDKWLACPQCPYKTCRKNSFKQHVLKHANPDQLEWYKCEQCSFKTYRKYDFKRHQMIHQDDNGSSWHKCPECPYKTTHKSHVLRHAKNHQAADQTDWLNCPECSYRTSGKSNLKAHQILHTAALE